MQKETSNHHEAIKKYLLLVISLSFIVISFFIVRPFAVALISAFVLAYLTKPLYENLKKRINKHLSAAFCLLFIILVLIAPLGIIIGGTISQSNTLINTDSFNKITNVLHSYPIFEKLDLESLKKNALSAILSALTSAITYIPSLIISIVIMLLGTYSILINWDKISLELKQYLPFRDKEKVSKEIALATTSIVHGYFLIAILEFVVGLLGFYLSGVEYYFILPLLIGIFAFIPGLGPAVIWVPTALYYFFTGDIATAIGVLITGGIISFIIETFLLGKIVGDKSNIHPIVFLVGILGGIPIFGLTGFIIGPLVLVYTIKLVREALKEN